MGYRTLIARYVVERGIAQMCLCETKYQGGGVSHHFGGVLASLKTCRAIWGIAAIVSQYCAIWGHYPLRRNDYQNNSVKIILCNCPGAITGFLCRAPENNSPNIFSCKSPCPVRAPPPRSLSRNHRDYGGSYRMRKIIPQKFYYIIAPGAITGFSCRAPENNSKIIFPACNHFASEGKLRRPASVQKSFAVKASVAPWGGSRVGIAMATLYSTVRECAR